MYDIIIIGAGPSGLTAGIYSRRAGKSVLIFEADAVGGQIASSAKVVNYPAFVEISGSELVENMFNQAELLGCEFEFDTVNRIDRVDNKFVISTDYNTYESRTVIIATGCRPRTLMIPEPEKYLGKGLGYCVVCDGEFYSGKVTAVVGGGNTALQDALYLSNICPKVYVFQNLPNFTGEQGLIDEVTSRKNIEVYFNSKVVGLDGEDSLSSAVVDIAGEEKTFDIQGIFVAIGHIPNVKMFSNIVNINDYGYITANEDMETSTPGVFVAGDVRDKKIRQLTTATSDGTIASISACNYIDRNFKN